MMITTLVIMTKGLYRGIHPGDAYYVSMPYNGTLFYRVSNGAIEKPPLCRAVFDNSDQQLIFGIPLFQDKIGIPSSLVDRVIGLYHREVVPNWSLVMGYMGTINQAEFINEYLGRGKQYVSGDVALKEVDLSTLDITGTKLALYSRFEQETQAFHASLFELHSLIQTHIDASRRIPVRPTN